MAVVAPVEFHHPIPPGRAAGQAHRTHGRLGTRRDQSHLLAPGNARTDGLGQKHLSGRGRPEGGTQCGRLRDGIGHHRMGVPEQDGPVGLHQIDVVISFNVKDGGALAPDHRVGSAADGRERPDG